MKEVRNDLSDANCDILATVEQGQGEVLEVQIPTDFEETKLMDLKMPVRAIIGIIQRRNKVIIPKGNSLIRAEDKLIVFTTAENAPQIKEFFKVKQCG